MSQTMKDIFNRRAAEHRIMAAAVAGLMESLMSDLADNPPEDFTEEDIARHREVAQTAKEHRNRLIGLRREEGKL